jgi:hypothetical protein
MEPKRYETWTLIDWDGNPALKLQCWRKSFRHGHVSIGVGNCHIICYSYGANSDASLSSTRARWQYGLADLTEQEAMDMVDRNDGRHNHRDIVRGPA